MSDAKMHLREERWRSFYPSAAAIGVSNRHSTRQSPRVVREDEEQQVWIYQGGALLMLEEIYEQHPAGVFELILADPLYSLDTEGFIFQSELRVRPDRKDWDKFSTAEQMHEFNRTWLAACQKALKPDGTIFVSGTSHVMHSVGFAMQQLGFKILNDIVWVRSNSPRGFSRRHYAPGPEVILWAAKNAKSKHTFNYQAMREEAGGKQMKSVWRDILWSAEDRQVRQSALWKKLRPNIRRRTMIDRPLALQRRLLRAATNKGDWVFDPFFCCPARFVAAHELGRRFVGVA